MWKQSSIHFKHVTFYLNWTLTHLPQATQRFPDTRRTNTGFCKNSSSNQLPSSCHFLPSTVLFSARHAAVFDRVLTMKSDIWWLFGRKFLHFLNWAKMYGKIETTTFKNVSRCQVLCLFMSINPINLTLWDRYYPTLQMGKLWLRVLKKLSLDHSANNLSGVAEMWACLKGKEEEPRSCDSHWCLLLEVLESLWEPTWVS